MKGTGSSASGAGARRVYVKICGLREPEHVRAAVEAGADAIGFVLTRSPRRVTPARARELASAVPPHVLTVAVFAGEAPDEVRAATLEAGCAPSSCTATIRMTTSPR